MNGHATSTGWQQLNADLAAAVSDARRGLVQITNGRSGAGAGTIWHPAGLVVTNAHVVARHHGLHVTLPGGETLPARVIAADADRDLAALVVEADDLPTIALGDSRTVFPGQWVTAIGHPWGILGAATGGIVIAVGADLPEAPRPGGHEWIVVDLHMRPGHSGGPLVDEQGRLIGINTMIAGPDVGFAVPVHAVAAFLKRHLSA